MSLEQQLMECQRYYEKSFLPLTPPAQNAGTANSELVVQGVGASTAFAYPITFKVNKRTAPTMTFFNPSAANAQLRNTTTNTDFSATTLVAANERAFMVSGTSPAASAAANNVIFHWVADARL